MPNYAIAPPVARPKDASNRLYRSLLPVVPPHFTARIAARITILASAQTKQSFCGLGCNAFANEQRGTERGIGGPRSIFFRNALGPRKRPNALRIFALGGALHKFRAGGARRTRR